jgi:alpha-D-xyloside xylohydrolase
MPDKRVMILTRSAFPGQQRYAAATWSGDIGNDWDTLRRQIPAGLNMAAAGYPYWTVDAGGFFRPGTPGTGQFNDDAYHERFIRWFQYATFLPLQRVHGYQTQTEFWRYGERVEAIARDYLNLRYRLLPYIYTMAADAWRTGAPLIRPLVFDFRDDSTALDEAHAYMFGRCIHVAPVFAPGVKTWSVYLPRAQGGWYDFWTDAHYIGGQRREVETRLSRIPLHVRAGTILPLGPAVQSTAEATGEALELHVYPGIDGAYVLYEDQGLDYGYERGAYALIPMLWDENTRVLELLPRQGSYSGMLAERTFKVLVHGTPAGAPSCGEIAYSGRRATIKLV